MKLYLHAPIRRFGVVLTFNFLRVLSYVLQYSFFALVSFKINSTEIRKSIFMRSLKSRKKLAVWRLCLSVCNLISAPKLLDNF
jgi:hypothetical protein